MGGLISGLFGSKNDFHAGTGYDPSYLNNTVAANTENQQRMGTFADALQAQANGQGVDPAAAMTLNQGQLNGAQAAGLVASQRGMNPAAAAKMATSALNQANAQANGTAGQVRSQDRLNAQGALGSVLANKGSQELEQQNMINQANMNANKVNSGVAEQNAKTNGGIMGGIMQGAGALGGMLLAKGGMIPGKAPVHGDSLTNDSVPAVLSPGEIVLPRSVTQSEHPESKAADFIHHIMSEKKKANPGPEGYGKVLAAHRELEGRVAELEKKRGKK